MQEMRIESAILSNLIHEEGYLRRAYPFLKEEYFLDFSEKTVFQLIQKYVDEYNQNPTNNILQIMLNDYKNISEEQFNEISNSIESFQKSEMDTEWLLDATEQFCKDKAIYNALMKSIQIVDGNDKEEETGAIPEILKEALSVSFDPHIGHDYLEDFEARFDFYHTKEDKIEFDLELFNKITKGGLSNKSLNIALAGTGVGKSLFMCHCASANLDAGKNVLYITLEMSEEKIAERIDANLLNTSIEDLLSLSKSMYEQKIQTVREKTLGKLIIKEYPTATAHVGNFRYLLTELALKKNFFPDIIYVDYINICASARLRQGANVNSYTYIKSIAEELRGLAVEKNVPLVSATQLTRSGFGNSDPDLTDTAESFGLPATADLMFALISTEDMEELNQIKVKQLKNRYNDPTQYRSFVIGIDRSKMRLYDLEQSAQVDLITEDDVVVPITQKKHEGWKL